MAQPTTAKDGRAQQPAGAKRLILVGGGKGGVGKSTFARALADYYETHAAPVTAFDGDLENPTLSRFIDGALPVATQTAKGFETVIQSMETGKAGHLVVDLGAGTQRHLAEFERLLGLADAARHFGYEPTLVWMLAPSKDSIGLLSQAIDAHQGWRLVIVRAVCVVGDWRLWDTSNTKRKADAFAPESIDFPILDADAFTGIDKKDLRFKDATRENLAYVDAAYAARWFAAVCQLFEGSPTLRAITK